MSNGDRQALQNVYGERAPTDDYLFITGTVNYSTVGKNIFNLRFSCRDVNRVNIYVRQQDELYRSAELDSEVCRGITETVVYIKSREIVSRNGVDHLEMKAEVEYHSNSITSIFYRILEDSEERVFTLPLDGKEHSFKIPRVYASTRSAFGVTVGGSHTDVTLKLRATNPNPDNLVFPHRMIVPSAATAPAIALTNGQVNPEETALLTNYPNPFNPETWIPYQLAKPSDVTLYIHGIEWKVSEEISVGASGRGCLLQQGARGVLGRPECIW